MRLFNMKDVQAMHKPFANVPFSICFFYRPFHALMSVNDDYMATVTSLDRNVTLFIPSARYLRTVTSEQMAMMSADPKILKRVSYEKNVLLHAT